MTADSEFPRRFRRRLTLAFVAVAALAAGALAVGSYVSVNAYRVSTFRDRAERQTDLNLELAAGRLDEASVAPLLDLYERRGRFDTLVVAPDGRVVAESERGLGHAMRGNRASTQRVFRDGVPYLVLAGRPSDSNLHLVFFYSEERLRDGLVQLRNSLAGGWAGVTLLAALVGSLMARRTLAPVARAAVAARSLTEGLLDTRLPTGGDDEFGEWARYFNEMAAALGAKINALADANERERRFTANVTHELRTPLGALVANASLLEARLEMLLPEARRPAELLLSDVNRLRDLVLDLLQLARLDAGHEDVHLETLSLRSAVAAVVATVRRDPPPDVELEDAAVIADRRRFERVVSNLVENAYTHGGQPVRVRAFAEGGHGVIEVQDQGAGIAQEDLERVFERFYKGDRSHSTQGSGLGLAIARDNARLMGASINVASRPGGPTTFTVRLPLGPRDDDVALERDASGEEEPPLSLAPLGGERAQATYRAAR